MLRVLLYVTLLGALFVGAVLWTGNAIGAWEPPNVPAPAPEVFSPGEKKDKKSHKGEQRAKRDKNP